MKKNIARILIACLLGAALILAVNRPPQLFYPTVEAEVLVSPNATTDMLVLNFLFDARSTIDDCEGLTGNVVRTLLKNCPQCRIRQLRCDTAQEESERILFTEHPVPVPTGRMNKGVITFHAANENLALAGCQATQAQSLQSHNPVQCYPANTARTKPSAPSLLNIWYAILFLAAFAASWLVGWLIIRYEHLHCHLSHDHVDSGPQKYHTQPTPRIGGLTMKAGLFAAGGIMLLTGAISAEHEFGLLLLAGIPAFLGGLVEDITKKVGVLERLLLTMLSSGLAAWLLGAVLHRLDIPFLDHALLWMPFAVALTVFAVAGIANAINILDGYNGLVGGYSIIVLCALAWVSVQVGDTLVFPVAVALAGAMVGFVKWNWPGGQIFLGDGGAYLLGFLLAELSVLLVARNPDVSPWFPLLLLIHPVFETCFSIYRRKFKDGLSPGQPDNQHLHQLIYKRIEIAGQRRLEHNSRVAKFLWGPTVVVAVIGSLYWRSTGIMVAGTIAYCIAYVASYAWLAPQKPRAIA